MQLTETLNEGLKRGYSMTLSAQDLDAKVMEKLKEAQPEIEIKGFRKGKVPLPMLKKKFGPQVMGEAMQEAIDGAVTKHFEDSGDRPAFQPDIKMVNEDWKEGDDIEVSVTYEALPPVPEQDFSSIELERLVVKPGKAEVKEALANLAENAQNFEDREEGAAAEDGDQVVFDFIGRVDGEAFDGGSAEDYPLTLGSGSFIPGFEDQLVGAKAGEKTDVTVTFPEEYQAEHLAGKEAVFECTVKSVRAPAKAKIDDELAKRFGSEDLKALKGQIAERLEEEYKGAARMVLKRNLLDALDAQVSFDLPPTMVETEAKQIAHQMWHDEHPEVHDHNHDEITPDDEHTKLAERRVRLGLLLADIGDKASLEVTDAEMNQAVIAQARQYPGQEQEFFKFVQSNPQMQQQLRAPIFEDKVVDHILAQATITDKEVSKDDLQAAVEALDD